MAAIFLATNPFLAKEGKKNIVVSSRIYGGTFMLLSERYGKERGIEVRWVKNPLDNKEWGKLIDKNTRFVFGEFPSNPTLSVFEIEQIAEIAHKNNTPLIVYSTLATPALLRPFQFGADIVVHSLSKTITASGLVIGGALISRHNLISSSLIDEAKSDFAQYVKLFPARDFGPALSPLSALLTLTELRTLRSRINVLSQRAQKIAEYLTSQPQIESVWYPGLLNFEGHEIAKKYLSLIDSQTDTSPAQSRFGHLIGITIKGDPQNARKVLDNFKLILRAADLGRIKTIATIPAISTHQQQGDLGRELAQIPANLIRLSVGGEHPDDVISDLDQALNQ